MRIKQATRNTITRTYLIRPIASFFNKLATGHYNKIIAIVIVIDLISIAVSK